MTGKNRIKELVGTKVRHLITLPDDSNIYEYGEIVSSWWDDGIVDCQIQLYKNQSNFSGELEEGTLRYYLTSLEPIDDKGDPIALDPCFYP